MDNTINILLIDDDENLYIAYTDIFTKNIKEDFVFDHVGSAEKIENAILSKQYDIIILDQKLDSGNKGLDFLPIIKKSNIYTYVIVNSGYGSETLAIEAMRNGANDYVKGNKDNNLELLNVVKKAIQHIKKYRDIENISNNFIKFNQNLENSILDKISYTKQKVSRFAAPSKK